ncbi:MAG: hypothetical protein U5K37_08560 [Natrialbaceae archaeon]|nr:hypothetical protein [Natrialbaceae archaeon]
MAFLLLCISGSAVGELTVNVTDNNGPVDNGETINVTANITNDASTQATETVSMSVEEYCAFFCMSRETIGVVDTTELTLASNESSEVIFSWNTTIHDGGEWDATVANSSHEDSTNFEVNITGSYFDVTLSDVPADTDPVAGDTIWMNVTVDNIGTESGTQIVNTNRESDRLG